MPRPFRKEMREGLSKAGYIEGRNVLFDLRSAEGRLDLLGYWFGCKGARYHK
jgi:hypothetical protein